MNNKIENQTFENVVVNMDGYHYIGCTFNHCQMVFQGTGGVDLKDCVMSNSAIAIVGPAMNTLNFLRSNYQAGGVGRALVEQVIRQIQGETPAQAIQLAAKPKTDVVQ